MRMNFKRIGAFLMALVLICSLLPAGVFKAEAAAAEEPRELTAADYARVDLVFDKIDAAESEPAKKNATDEQKVEEAIAIVMASDSYVEGSLVQSGNSFTWWTDNGISCIYSPRMQKIEENQTPETSIDAIINEPVATKGGSPAGNQVYLIGPYYGSDSNFTNQYKNEASRVAEAIGDADGYTLYSGKAATIDKVAEAMSNGAVVFFDSHGDTDYANPYDEYDFVTGATTSYLCLATNSGLTTADYNAGAKYSDGTTFVNGAAIANHMTKNSPSGILWMAICLGMATDGLYKPMREKGVEVVYGYSESVSFDGDYLYEETFWGEMIEGKTVAQSVATMKSKWGNWDWSVPIASYYGYTSGLYAGYATISEARADYTAFPIVVSDEDAWPGQRTSNSNYGSDSLQTVKSTYAFTSYEISVSSNNAAWGTAAVSGKTITATPAAGYYASGYTVLSGSATVTQSGNVFSVAANSDCSIRIDFAPKTAATVTLMQNGVTASTKTGIYVGDPMTLPAHSGEAPKGAKFVGWVTAQVAETETKPALVYPAGASYTPMASSVTLYALYSIAQDGSTGGGDTWELVTDASTLSAGDLLVFGADDTSNGDFVAGEITGSSNKYMSSVSATITNKAIAAVPESAVQLTLGGSAGAWTFTNASGNKLGATGAKKMAWDSGTTTWSISVSSGKATIQNGTSSYGRILYNVSSPRFTTYASSTGTSTSMLLPQIYRQSGKSLYSTTIGPACEHVNTYTVDAQAATCTTDGYTAGTFCQDCEQYTEGHVIIPATNHANSETIEAKDPTCFEGGYTAGVYCFDCEAYVSGYVMLEALNHKNQYETPEVAKTCATDGYTAGVYCPDCKVYLSGHERIPAQGHNYVDGVCTNCGGNASSATTGTTATITFDSEAKRVDWDGTYQLWEENGITVTNNQAASQSPVADYVNPARFYKNSELIIEFTEPITEIAFTCSSASYATALSSSITSGTVTVDGQVVTVILEEAATSYTIDALSGGQVRMSAITVTGAATACTEHSWGEWTVETEATKDSTGLKYHVCSACGEREDKVIPQLLRFQTASLTLLSSVQVNFKVQKAVFDTYGYTDAYAVFALNGNEYTVDTYRADGNYYVFDFSELTPANMGDTITGTLYARNTVDGEDYVSKAVEYSVLKYCNNQLPKLEDDSYAEFRTLLVDLLNYGAATQKYTGHNTDALVNAGLTETQKSWGTATLKEPTVNQQKITDQVANSLVAWKGAGLILEDAVVMTAKLQADSGLSGITIQVTCGGRSWTFAEGDEKLVSLGNNQYNVVLDELGVYQMREPVYFVAYKDDAAVSSKLAYSVQTYANKNADDTSYNVHMPELLDAMMKYGDAVYAYVN